MPNAVLAGPLWLLQIGWLHMLEGSLRTRTHRPHLDRCCSFNGTFAATVAANGTAPYLVISQFGCDGLVSNATHSFRAVLGLDSLTIPELRRHALLLDGTLTFTSGETYNLLQIDSMGSVVSTSLGREARRLAATTTAGPRKGLLVGAGRGTTGTHSVHDAACLMDLPSVHWDEHCNVPKGSLNPHARVMGMYTKLEACLILGSKRIKSLLWKFQLKESDFLGGKMIAKYFFLKEILAEAPEAFWSGWQISCTDTGAWASKFLASIFQVVRSPVDSVHDSPYTFVLPDLISYSSAFRGLQPFVVLSTRDPIHWVKKRVESHGDDPVCKDRKVDPFDIMGCIRKAMGLGAGHKLPLQAVFTTQRQLVEHNRKSGMDHLENEMKYFQAAWRRKANVSIDMFTEPKPSTLAAGEWEPWEIASKFVEAGFT